MIEFHPISADDYAWAAPLMRRTESMICSQSFVTEFMWSPVFATGIARSGDWVLIRSRVGEDYYYLWPQGGSDPREAIDLILEDGKRHGRGVKIFSITQEDSHRLEEWYPGQFELFTSRDASDYIYEQKDLANLAGRRFQKKRNHVSRFIRENPDWEFHRLTAADIPLVRSFNDMWSRMEGNAEDPGIQQEHSCIELLFDNFEKLEIQGGYITAGGRVVAYSMGSAINEDVFDTNVEKALYEVTGAYNIINREMAAQVCSGYRLINREDDVGDEGLRSAKLSYNPAIIEPKYLAKWLG